MDVWRGGPVDINSNLFYAQGMRNKGQSNAFTLLPSPSMNCSAIGLTSSAFAHCVFDVFKLPTIYCFFSNISFVDDWIYEFRSWIHWGRVKLDSPVLQLVGTGSEGVCHWRTGSRSSLMCMHRAPRRLLSSLRWMVYWGCSHSLA
jgi:hypothetical protein